MNLTIKHKLIAIALLVAFGLIFLYLESTHSQSQIKHLQHVQNDISELQIGMLQLRRNEKDFLLRKDTKYLDKFKKNSAHELKASKQLIDDLNSADMELGKVNAINSGLTAYQQAFTKLVEAWVNKGLAKDVGHYGSLRKATHDMETLLKQQNDLKAHVLLLTLRRHEKDFILRSDEKYLDKLHKTAEELRQHLTSSEATSLLDKYVAEFDAFVKISKFIGLNSKQGLLGEMRAIVHQVETDLNTESKRIEKSVKEHIESAEMSNAIITFIFSIALVLIILLIAQQIVTSLSVFSSRISQIKQDNDLSQRVAVTPDEIGKVANEFNHFLEHFQQLVQRINDTVTELTNSAQVVSSSVSKTSDGLSVQAQESDMVATAVTEMGSAAQEIAGNAHLTKEKTDQATVNAGDGQTKLDGTITNISQLSDALIGASDKTSTLQEKSNAITSVLEVIKGIAEQTNLLALNAAIEAARAGEQGRGFAVVADEVRTLAMRTQESTQEISTIIDDLQVTTSDIVGVVDNCKQQGIEGVEQAKETEIVLNNIISDVNDIANMTVEVATAVEEQSAVVQDVDRNIVRIRDIGDQVAADAEDNANASQNVAHLAEALQKEANTFKV